jgi:tetratricopeptide (TPR) repeat protein
LYLAMIGPALVVASLLSRRPSRGGGGVAAIVACVVAILGVRTFAQTQHWRDSRALFTHALEVNPRSFASYAHLASLANQHGEPDRALELIQKAIAIRPDGARFAIYAETLRRKGRTNEAIAAYREALQRDNAYPPALANLAAMLAEQGRLDEAIPLARRAVELEPQSARNRFNLALMYLNRNQGDLAREQLEAVLGIDPNHAGARQLLNR